MFNVGLNINGSLIYFLEYQYAQRKFFCDCKNRKKDITPILKLIRCSTHMYYSLCDVFESKADSKYAQRRIRGIAMLLLERYNNRMCNINEKLYLSKAEKDEIEYLIGISSVRFGVDAKTAKKRIEKIFDEAIEGYDFDLKYCLDLYLEYRFILYPMVSNRLHTRPIGEAYEEFCAGKFNIYPFVLYSNDEPVAIEYKNHGNDFSVEQSRAIYIYVGDPCLFEIMFFDDILGLIKREFVNYKNKKKVKKRIFWKCDTEESAAMRVFIDLKKVTDISAFSKEFEKTLLLERSRMSGEDINTNTDNLLKKYKKPNLLSRCIGLLIWDMVNNYVSNHSDFYDKLTVNKACSLFVKAVSEEDFNFYEFAINDIFKNQIRILSELWNREHSGQVLDQRTVSKEYELANKSINSGEILFHNSNYSSVKKMICR